MIISDINYITSMLSSLSVEYLAISTSVSSLEASVTAAPPSRRSAQENNDVVRSPLQSACDGLRRRAAAGAQGKAASLRVLPCPTRVRPVAIV